MINTGIYIHIPFCQKKCAYCDFYSMPSTPQVIKEYVEELKSEIISNGKKHTDKLIDTVYIGGGTPSILDIKHIESILLTIFSNYNCKIKECTIELNPCSSKDISQYTDIGINRLSVGVQSLDNNILKTLGRQHNAKQAIDTLQNASKYFDNISVDFILGVKKGDKIQKHLANSPFIELLQENIKHISAYILKVEENTPLSKYAKEGEYKILDDDELANQYENAYKYFESIGFLRYEISNFAKEGYESKHNLKYWQMLPYLGFGVNAHSFVDGKRYFNKRDIKSYLSGEHSGNNKQIPEKSDKLLEVVMLSLRTRQGLDINNFNKEFGFDFLSKYQKKLENIKKFTELSNDFLRIKDEYLLLQNSIVREILY